MIRRQIPANYELLCAVSMLADEGAPVLCSCCIGTGKNSALFGFRRCRQCDGVGYDMLGKAALAYLTKGPAK